MCRWDVLYSNIIIHNNERDNRNQLIKGSTNSKGKLRYSRKVLREHGNMSSPTVLYVLKEFLDDGRFSRGDYGLISALGPGFSSELLLFQTA